jgi:GrpB-like predicted nucleotidyltransferase (UPF0157 family)
MIRDRVPGIAVEPVGSTAVPGCAGKGVVDLTIPYREGELAPVESALEDLGFGRQGTRDPFRMRVHVVPAGSGDPAEFRAFRDRLRSHPELLRRYVGRKRHIIEGGATNPIEYAQSKGDFVRQALGGMGR